MKTRTSITLGFSLLGGLVAGSLAMLAAWDHNPQGAFHEHQIEGSQIIHWGSWLLVGVGWLVPVFVVICVATTIVATVMERRED